MKLAARLTLDGLIRALRARGHDLADRVERERPRAERTAPGPVVKRDRDKGEANGFRRR